MHHFLLCVLGTGLLLFVPSFGGFVDLTFLILRINLPLKLRRHNKVHEINTEFGLHPKVHHVLCIKDDVRQHAGSCWVHR